MKDWHLIVDSFSIKQIRMKKLIHLLFGFGFLQQEDLNFDLIHNISILYHLNYIDVLLLSLHIFLA